MNITKLLLAIAIASLCRLNAAKAQTNNPSPWRLGIGLETGATTGFNDNKDLKIALGGTARLQYSFNSKLAATLTSGYYNFFLKNRHFYSPDGLFYSKTVGFNQGMVPVKLGLKYYLTGGFYAIGEAGAGFETSVGKDTKLILAPGLGYAKGHLDLGLRYENFSDVTKSSYKNNYGLVGLRIAYGFGL